MHPNETPLIHAQQLEQKGNLVSAQLTHGFQEVAQLPFAAAGGHKHLHLVILCFQSKLEQSKDPQPLGMETHAVMHCDACKISSAPHIGLSPKSPQPVITEPQSPHL